MDGNVLGIECGLALSDGYRIPRMGFGTYELGQRTTDAVLAAVESGFRLIDCARLYANEREVGAAIASCGVPREELFVTSKVWNDRQIDGTVRESIESSLADLGLDYLDLFLVHWPVRDCYRKTWEVLLEAKRDGLVRSVGVSNFLPDHLAAIIADGGETPVVDQMEHHPFCRDARTRAFCAAAGIVYEAWSPLGSGALLNDARIGEIARRHGASSAQVVLAWELREGIVPLPRSASRAHIESNAAAIGLRLTDDEARVLDAMDQQRHVNEGVDPLHFNEILNAVPSPR